LACHTAARQMASRLGCATQVHSAQAQFKMAMNHVSLNIRIPFCIFTLLEPTPLARAPIALRSKLPFSIRPVRRQNSRVAFGVMVPAKARKGATSVALLASAAPSMISLSSSPSPATATSATSALGLKGAAHFVAVDGARESQGHGTPLYLHTKKHVVSSNVSSHWRGSARVLKLAAQLGPVLLDLHCGLLGTAPALPRNLPSPTNASGLRIIRIRTLCEQKRCGKKKGKSNGVQSSDQVSLPCFLYANTPGDLWG